MCGYKLERTGAVRRNYLDDKGMQMTECCEERTSKESDIIIMMGDEEKIVEKGGIISERRVCALFLLLQHPLRLQVSSSGSGQD